MAECQYSFEEMQTVTQEAAQPINISTLSLTELLRVVEEVRATKEPRALVLQQDTEPVAMLTPMPVVKKRPRRAHSPEAILEAVRATAGVWKDLVDGEQLKKDIKEERGDSRPAVTL
jgi:predicted RNase H-like nuclease